MQIRLRTLLVVMSIVAVFLGVLGWGVRQQQRASELEARVAALEQQAATAKATAKAAYFLQQPGTNIGVRWEVEKAMLMDGVSPAEQRMR